MAVVPPPRVEPPEPDFVGEASFDRVVQAARRQLGTVVATLLVPFTLIPLFLVETGRLEAAPAVPAPLVAALVAELAALVAIRRGVVGAERVLPWIVALTVAFGTTEPHLTLHATQLIHGAPALAMALGSPAELVAAYMITWGVLVARSPEPAPYLRFGYVLGLAYVAGAMLVSQWFLRRLLHRTASISRRFQAVLDGSHDLVLTRTPTDEIGFVSPAVRRLLGEDPGANRAAWIERVHPDDLDAFTSLSARARSAAGGVAQATFRLRHRDGHWRWFDARATNLLGIPEVGAVVVTAIDVTERERAREDLQARLLREAQRDALTGLPNRRGLRDRLGEILAQRPPGASAVLFLDLDNFKVVNDSLGHDVGDQLLAATADVLATVLSQAELVARLGGDEFVALLAGQPDAARVLAAAEQTLAALRRPMMVDGRRLATTASMGVAFLREDHDRPESVLRDADVALYSAKSAGRDRCAVFDDTMRSDMRRWHDLEQALRVAVDHDEIFFLFQPKVRLGDGGLVGFEALARWTREDGVVVPPDTFIPIAEETGLIVAIGERLLERATAQLAVWQRAMPFLRMAVNLSMRQLSTPAERDRFVEVLTRVTRDIAPGTLELELTESAFLGRMGPTREMLAAVRALGVRVAVDDFGTGYSSLAHLRDVPFDILKIDRSFVLQLGDPVVDETVRFVVRIAHTLGAEVVAEGVETHEQATMLAALGVEGAQGWRFGRPGPPDAWLALVSGRG